MSPRMSFSSGKAPAPHQSTHIVGGSDAIEWTDLLPDGANTRSIGSATLEWANLYIGTGRVYFFTDQAENIYSDGTDLIFTSGRYVNLAAGTDLNLDANTIWVDDEGSAANRLIRTDTGNMNIWMSDTQRSQYLVGYNMDVTHLGPNLKLIASGDSAYDVPAIAFYNSNGALGDTQLGSLLADNANVNLYAFPSTYSLVFLTYDTSGDAVGAKLWIGPGDAATIQWWSNAWFKIYSDEGGTETFAIDGATGIVYVRGSILDGDVNTNDLGGTGNEFANAYIGTGRLWLYTDQGEYIFSTGTVLTFGVGGGDELGLSTAALYPTTAQGLDLGGVANEWQNLFLGNGRLYFYLDQGESIRSTGDVLVFAIGTGDELGLSTAALYPTTASGLDLGVSTNEWQNLFLSGAIYFYADQGEYIFSTGDVLSFGISSANVMHMSTVAWYPNTNKVETLGVSSNRWGASFISGNTTGTSRTVRSNITCAIHTDTYCVKGTGGVVMTGYRWDYQQVFCPICGTMYAEKTDYSSLVSQDSIPPPDSIELWDIKVSQHGAYGLMLELHFDYHYRGEIEQNATYLGVKEYDDFESLDEEGQEDFIARLAMLEWNSHIRQKRMSTYIETKNRTLRKFKGRKLKLPKTLLPRRT